VNQINPRPRSEEPTHRGFKTSEFWLSLLGAAIGLILCYHSRESMQDFGVMLVGTSVGAYSLSRGFAKQSSTNQISATVVTPQQLTP